MQLSNRLLFVTGLTMSIIAFSLLGDWQAIRPDPCTESSIFHHPELQQQYISQLAARKSPKNAYVSEIFPCNLSSQSLILLEYMTTTDIFLFPKTENADSSSKCELVQSNPTCTELALNENYLVWSRLLHLRLDFESPCPHLAHGPKVVDQRHGSVYSCSIYSNNLQLMLYICVYSTSSSIQYRDLDEYVARVHLQTVQVIAGRLAALAEEICEGQPHHSCHWNPHSEVTGRYCEDCPPICRDKTNYLQFSQFLLGVFLLLVFFEYLRVTTTGMISDIVDDDKQVSIGL